MLVEQEIHGEELTPIEILLETDVERTRLLEIEDRVVGKQERGEKVSDEEEQALMEAQTRLMMIEASKQPARAQAILAGLGFT